MGKTNAILDLNKTQLEKNVNNYNAQIEKYKNSKKILDDDCNSLESVKSGPITFYNEFDDYKDRLISNKNEIINTWNYLNNSSLKKFCGFNNYTVERKYYVDNLDNGDYYWFVQGNGVDLKYKKEVDAKLKRAHLVYDNEFAPFVGVKNSQIEQIDEFLSIDKSLLETYVSEINKVSDWLDIVCNKYNEKIHVNNESFGVDFNNIVKEIKQLKTEIDDISSIKIK